MWPTPRAGPQCRWVQLLWLLLLLRCGCGCTSASVDAVRRCVIAMLEGQSVWCGPLSA